MSLKIFNPPQDQRFIAFSGCIYKFQLLFSSR